MRRAIAASTLCAAIIAGTTSGVVQANEDDRDRSSMLAEAQFQIFILTGTDFVPSDVTCTLPPMHDVHGDLLCYALLTERVSIAAIATAESPGEYRFTPLNKVDPADIDHPRARGPTVEQSAIDDAVIASMESAVADADGLTEVLMDANEEIVSVDDFAFDDASATLQIEVTTNSIDSADRDAVAFSVTDIMAYLWESGEPLRSESATVHPSIEVTVDGTLYATPFGVIVQVADYEIGEDEWLETIADDSSLRARSRSDAIWSNVKKASARLEQPSSGT